MKFINKTGTYNMVRITLPLLSVYECFDGDGPLMW